MCFILVKVFSSEAFYCFLSLHHPLRLPLFAAHIIYAPVYLSLALKEIRPSKADGNDALNTSDVWTPRRAEFNRGRRENEAGHSGGGEVRRRRVKHGTSGSERRSKVQG